MGERNNEFKQMYPLVINVISGEKAGATISFDADTQVTVGRADNSDFALVKDLHLSRVHFSFFQTSEGLLIRDLNSSNGTFVNGKRITKQLLQPSDEIFAGSTLFRVMETQDEDESGTGTEKEESLREAGQVVGASDDSESDFQGTLPSPMQDSSVGTSAQNTVISPEVFPRDAEVEGGIVDFENPASFANLQAHPSLPTGSSLPASSSPTGSIREDEIEPPDDSTHAISIADSITARLSYTGEELINGLIRYRGKMGRVSFMEIANVIAEKAPLNLLVNVKKAPSNMRSFLSSPSRAQKLCWLKENETTLLTPECDFDVLQILRHCWGTNSAIVIFSELDSDSLYKHIKKSEASFCEAHVMHNHLRDSSPEYAQQLVKGLFAIMVEKRKKDPNWTIYVGGIPKTDWRSLNLPTGPS